MSFGPLHLLNVCVFFLIGICYLTVRYVRTTTRKFRDNKQINTESIQDNSLIHLEYPKMINELLFPTIIFQEMLGLPNLDNFHFIGHSLGAHLAGYCGHGLQKVITMFLQVVIYFKYLRM